MHYLTTPFTLNFNPNTIPSYNSQVNGMSTKTNAVQHALDCDVISGVGELSRLTDTNLLIEPLWFKSHSDALEDAFEKKLAALNGYRGKKYLLCSEFTPLRWKGKQLSEIIPALHAVFASCYFQQDLFNAIDIESEAVVYEPVNEHLFYPTAKQDWVIAIGSPTHMKNIDAILEIFEGLEGSGLKRIFIGSPIVWGQMTGLKNESSFQDTMRKYEQLKAVCDEHYVASAPTVVAYFLSQAKYYLNFAYHETCCRTAMEAMLCGTGILAGEHPLFEEYPCVANGLTPTECVELLKTHPEVDVDNLRNWALQNVSYAAFRKKIEGLLK